MEADLCEEDTEAYVTNLSYYHLVPFETDILEWRIYLTVAHWWTHRAVIEEYVLLKGTRQCNDKQYTYVAKVNAASNCSLLKDCCEIRQVISMHQNVERTNHHFVCHFMWCHQCASSGALFEDQNTLKEDRKVIRGLQKPFGWCYLEWLLLKQWGLHIKNKWTFSDHSLFLRSLWNSPALSVFSTDLFYL